MKIAETRTEIQRDGIGESKGFQIKASAQAFRILSDGLYSDKVKAIVRELGSNAWDAHVSAGTTDRPFDVHLPNQIEPWYAIRDYGTGLAHEQVMGLYSTYFDSTKSDSNDFTGAMGLGSKSPFSYTDAFTVTSYYNGEMRIYMIDIGTDGVPHVGLVDGSPFPTQEPNGLEIKIAVKQEDFHNFQRKAEEVFKRYPLVPNVVGTGTFEIEKVKYSYEGEGWRLCESRRDQSYAIQGTVSYPIRVDNLQGINYDKRRLYNNLSLELDFEIGDLEVSASREDLGYDERTSKNIIAAFEKAVEELTRFVDEEFKAYTNHWDAACALGKIECNSRSGLHGLVYQGLITPSWQGEQIDTGYIYAETTENLQFATFNLGDGTVDRVLRNYKPDINRDRLRIGQPSANITFVVDDLEKGGLQRFKHYVKENGGGRDNKFVLIRKTTRSSLTAFRKHLRVGNKKFLKTSNMDKPPRQAPAPRPKVDRSICDASFFTGKTSNQRDRWRYEGEVQLADVAFTFDVYQGGLDTETYKELGWDQCPGPLYKMAIKFGLITHDDKVYGVPRNLRKRFAQYAPQAKDLVEVIRTYIKDNKDSLADDMEKAANASQFRREMGYGLSRKIRPFKFLNENNLGGETVKAFFNVFGQNSVDESWLDAFSNGARRLKIELVEPEGDAEVIKAKWFAMTARYPMLKYLEGYDDTLTNKEQVDVKAYVAMIDAK